MRIMRCMCFSFNVGSGPTASPLAVSKPMSHQLTSHSAPYASHSMTRKIEMHMLNEAKVAQRFLLVMEL